MLEGAMTPYEFFSVMVDALDDEDRRWSALFVLARLFELGREGVVFELPEIERREEIVAATYLGLMSSCVAINCDKDQRGWARRLAYALLRHIEDERAVGVVRLMRLFGLSHGEELTEKGEARSCLVYGEQAYDYGCLERALVLLSHARALYVQLGDAEGVKRSVRALDLVGEYYVPR